MGVFCAAAISLITVIGCCFFGEFCLVFEIRREF